MIITNIRTYRVNPRWLFLAIDTDEGITGWGEPVLEGRAKTAEVAVEELKPLLIGQNPLNINYLWQRMYTSSFYRGGPILMSALSGIDQALWDIKGKFLGQPVYELLGGLGRQKVKTYSWVGGDDPADEIIQIERQRETGQDSFKLNGCGKLKFLESYKGIDQVIKRIGDIRTHFGNQIDFALDFHGRVSLPMAKVLLKELEVFRPLFVEEPVLPEFYDHYCDLSNQTSIPLAAGERAHSKFEFRKILSSGGLSIIQPDLSHAGGITECLKIASMADSFNVGLAPHCPLGPIALASCFALDFVSPNTVIQEFALNIHYNKGVELLDYVLNKEDFVLEDGYMKPFRKPGLGVEINEEFLIEKAKSVVDWYPPSWYQDDGSVAEW
ncbi:galactonate dehydratase [Shewanella acanthi]|uniref:galactonate dehydratase n=1 Tax=Shewanella acanthi TaxID=2864212 RepID=UPI001C65E5FF|nr:galactonate dehydratase [Shewanella acanthi]QYJ78340.1 galactonate dehydratase [Shewanella acanthi]